MVIREADASCTPPTTCTRYEGEVKNERRGREEDVKMDAGETHQRDDEKMQRETSLGLSLSFFFFFLPLLPCFSEWVVGRLSLSLCESRAAQQLRLRHLPLFARLKRRAGIPLRRLLTQSANSG